MQEEVEDEKLNQADSGSCGEVGGLSIKSVEAILSVMKQFPRTNNHGADKVAILEGWDEWL